MSRMRLRKKIYINKKTIIIVIIISIFFLVLRSLILFSNKSKEYLNSFAESESVIISTSIINKAIKDEISKEDLKELTIISKDKNGQITDIAYNNDLLNKILYSVTNNILESINNLEENNADLLNLSNYSKKNTLYYVPIGVIYDIPAIVNITPKIPFKITFLGTTEVSSEAKVKEYGINNSINEISLRVDMSIMIIFPFISKTVKISKNIPLSSNVIEGKIPSYYGGLISKSSKIYNY